MRTGQAPGCWRHIKCAQEQLDDMLFRKLSHKTVKYTARVRKTVPEVHYSLSACMGAPGYDPWYDLRHRGLLWLLFAYGRCPIEHRRRNGLRVWMTRR